MSPEVAEIPPSPGALPLFGHSVALLRDPLAFLRSAADAGPVTGVRCGPLNLVLVNDLDLAREVLTDTRRFTRGRLVSNVHEIIGPTRIGAEGEVHATQRRLVQPALSRGGVNALVPAMGEVARTRVCTWRAGQEVDVPAEMMWVVCAISLHCLFGVSAEPVDIAAIRHGVHAVGDAVLARIFIPPPLHRLPTPGQRRARRALVEFDAFVGRLIEQRCGLAEQPDDLLAVLLSTGADDEEVRSEVKSMLEAATETTSASLAWALYELAVHPEIQREVHKEVDDVLADGPVDAEQLRALRVTRRVVVESLRLHSVALITRRALEDVTLGGTSIRRDTEIGVSPYALHLNHRVFPDPQRFDPARDSAGALLTFAMGAYRCLGELLALVEMTAVLAAVAQRWTLEPVPGQRIKAHISAVPHPGRLRLRATPRGWIG
jgi:cyclooctat-9-en-7-ol 5-monooxygenase